MLPPKRPIIGRFAQRPRQGKTKDLRCCVAVDAPATARTRHRAADSMESYRTCCRRSATPATYHRSLRSTPSTRQNQGPPRPRLMPRRTSTTNIDYQGDVSFTPLIRSGLTTKGPRRGPKTAKIASRRSSNVPQRPEQIIQRRNGVNDYVQYTYQTTT